MTERPGSRSVPDAGGLSPDDVVREARFVQRLALRLASPDVAADADDLAQDALERALRKAETARGPARPWLSSIVRRLAANRARAASRRRAHERTLADRDTAARAAPAAADLVAREEVRTHVARALDALEEPYRATLLSRFRDGASYAEIARRSGVEPATVRSRTRRGLETMRARLDREFGDRAAWSGPWTLLLSGGARTALLAAGTVPRAAAAALVVVLLGIASAGLGGWLGPDPDPVDLPPSADAARARSAPAERRGARPDAAPTPGVRRAASDANAPDDPDYPFVDVPPLARTVRVVDGATGKPVAGALVKALVRAPVPGHEQNRWSYIGRVERLGATYPTGPDGTCAVRAAPGYPVFARDGHRVGFAQLPAAGRVVARVVLGSSILYRVRVVDPDGMAVAGACVSWSSTSVARTDGRGVVSFTWPADEPAPWCSVPGFAARGVRASADPDETAVLVLPRSGILRLDVRTPGGRPLPLGNNWQPRRLQALSDPSWTLRFRGPLGMVEPLRVPLGEHFRLEAMFSFRRARGTDVLVESIDRIVAGPTASQPDVLARVDLETPVRIVRARLVHPAGRDLEGSWCFATMVEPWRFGTGRFVGADGAVEWFVPVTDGVASGQLTLEAAGERADGDVAGPLAWCLPAADTDDEVVDLGVLEFPSAAVVCGGRVEGALTAFPVDVVLEGRAEGDAWRQLAVERLHPGALRHGDATPFVFRGDAADAMRIRLRGEGYQLGHAVPVTRGADDLVVRLDEHASGLHPFSATLRTPDGYEASWTATLAAEDPGSLRLPTPFESGDLVEPVFRARVADAVPGRGIADWPAVPAGRYRLTVTLAGLAPRTLSGIQVGTGEVDPRLRPLDLRTDGQDLLVQLGPDTLAAAPDPRDVVLAARPCAAGATDTRRAEAFVATHFGPRGRARLRIGSLPADLVVAAPGFRTAELRAGSSPVTLELEPPIRLRLRLAPEVAERVGPRPVEFRLRPLEQPRTADGAPTADPPVHAHAPGRALETGAWRLSRLRHPEPPFRSWRSEEPGGIVEIPVSAHGRFVVEVLVVGERRARSMKSFARPGGQQPLDWAVLDSERAAAGGGPHVLRPPPDAVEAALR